MKSTINYLDWRKTLEGKDTIFAIDDNFILVDEPIIPAEIYKGPFKINVLVGVICTKGYIQGKANLQSYRVVASSMFIVMPDMVLEFDQMSEDFEGRIIIMSKFFLSNMYIDNSVDALVNIFKKLFIPMQDDEMKAVMMYYEAVKNVVIKKDNPYRIKIIKLLTTAFFYGAGYYIHKLEQGDVKNKNEILLKHFLEIVQENFKQQRGIGFYAEKLNLTPKYMSTIIKQTSSKSAGEWIDSYVMLEAKALLRSSNMTIQQISDELNFPDQSSFGKFFKRHEKISPKSFRNNF